MTESSKQLNSLFGVEMSKPLIFGHPLGQCALGQLTYEDKKVSIKIGKVLHLANLFDVALLKQGGLAMDFSSKQLLALLDRVQSVLQQQLLNVWSLQDHFPQKFTVFMWLYPKGQVEGLFTQKLLLMKQFPKVVGPNSIRGCQELLLCDAYCPFQKRQQIFLKVVENGLISAIWRGQRLNLRVTKGDRGLINLKSRQNKQNLILTLIEAL